MLFIDVIQVAFEVMSMVAVATNCALMAFSPEVQSYTSIYGSTDVTLAFVFAEVGIHNCSA